MFCFACEEEIEEKDVSFIFSDDTSGIVKIKNERFTVETSFTSYHIGFYYTGNKFSQGLTLKCDDERIYSICIDLKIHEVMFVMFFGESEYAGYRYDFDQIYSSKDLYDEEIKATLLLKSYENMMKLSNEEFRDLEDRERYGYHYLFLIDPKENQESNQPTE